jgi:predicted nucleotidyltransferase
MRYLPRDFIETAEGLIFAVVDPQPEQGRILCQLRYRRVSGRPCKLSTSEAHRYLTARAPGYLFASTRLKAPLHAVPESLIQRHYLPRQRVAELLTASQRDLIEDKAVLWLRLMADYGLNPSQIGITGSLLIGAQHPASDLDFVIYGRADFMRVRDAIGTAIAAGQLQALGPADWQEAWNRRGCALGFDEYLWHEARKFNKGLCDGTKFDITLLDEDDVPRDDGPVRKLGAILIQTEISDASHGFDCPARYALTEPGIRSALSFTQTYAGQALAGERVEIAGMLEETAAGDRQIVVGSSREAPGEYIRVITPGHAP